MTDFAKGVICIIIAVILVIFLSFSVAQRIIEAKYLLTMCDEEK